MKIAATIEHAQMSYYIDHLAPLCSILNAPLFVSDKKLEKLARKYYPQIKCFYFTPLEITSRLAAQDALLVADSFSYFKSLQKMLGSKSMQYIYHPHGNSDKGMDAFGLHETCIIYGDQMLRRLEDCGKIDEIKNLIIGGNIRKEFYQEHQELLDNLLQNEIKLELSKKTLLYAPTWGHSSSFLHLAPKLIEEVPESWNLIIKLHPYLEQHHPEKVYALRAKKNIAVLTHFPLVYPLLYASDAYLGDYSSVGYDFLSTNQPLFFVKSKEDALLHQTGMALPQNASPFAFISKNFEKCKTEFESIRKNIYLDVFATSISSKKIKSALKIN